MLQILQAGYKQPASMIWLLLFFFWFNFGFQRPKWCVFASKIVETLSLQFYITIQMYSIKRSKYPKKK